MLDFIYTPVAATIESILTRNGKDLPVAKRESDPGFAPDWCVHFRSMAQHQTCKEGIDYTALNGGSEYHRMHRLPCFIKNSDKPKQRVGCEHFTAPSVQEIALHRQWDDDRQNRLTTALM